MKALVLNIGNEVIKGQVVNTHSQFLSLFLESLGINVTSHMGVLDQKQDIVNALTYAHSVSDIIILTGGLGPTQDDLTKEALASFLGEKLLFDEKESQRMKQISKRKLITYTSNNDKQAYYLENTIFLDNPLGVVRGHYIKRNHRIFILLPGPPLELEPMVKKSLSPVLINAVVGDNYYFVKEYSFVGIRESLLEDRIHSVIEQYEEELLQIGTYAFKGFVAVRITCYNQQLESFAIECAHQIKQILLPYFISDKGETLEQALIDLLSEHNIKIRMAESCTGGMIASRLTSKEGASRILESSIVTYSNESKVDLLGVPKDTIDRYGVVSENVARAMIKGLQKQDLSKQSETPFFIATTGNLKSPFLQKEEKEGQVFVATCYGADPKKIKVKEYDVGTYPTREMMCYMISQWILESVWFQVKKG